jgi:hypothetical protein
VPFRPACAGRSRGRAAAADIFYELSDDILVLELVGGRFVHRLVCPEQMHGRRRPGGRPG